MRGLTTVVETHPEDVVDLRLDCPWPDLSRLAATLNLEEMDDFEHGHIPYVLILVKFLQKWVESVHSFHGMSDHSSIHHLRQ